MTNNDKRRHSVDKKDKRIKGCPDPECERHIEHFKYKSTDKFCTRCGSQLAFVCAKCFEPIEDTEDQRRFCEACKPKESKDSENLQKPSKNNSEDKEQKAKEKVEKKQEKEEKKQEREEKKAAEKQEQEAKKLEKKEQKEAAKAQKPPKEKKAPGEGKDTFSKGVAVIKGKAPQIKEGAKKIARNPKVQRAALEVAEIAKDSIKHRKTRRIVGILIRAAKK